MSASAVTDYGHQICTADASDVDAPNDRFAPPPTLTIFQIYSDQIVKIISGAIMVA